MTADAHHLTYMVSIVYSLLTILRISFELPPLYEKCGLIEYNDHTSAERSMKSVDKQ